MSTSETQGSSSTKEKRPSPFALIFAPDRAMYLQALAGRAFPILLFVWACSLLLAGALAMRVDARASTLSKLEMTGEVKNMSDRQIAEETQKSERIFKVVTIAKSAVMPPIELGMNCLALLGICWFLRGRVKKRAVVPVAAATLLPGALADLLDAASTFQHAVIPPEGVPLVPRTLTALYQLIGHPLAPPWIKLGNALDFFSLWSAVLMAYGVSAAGQLPKKNAVIGTLVAWVCFRLLTEVATGS